MGRLPVLHCKPLCKFLELSTQKIAAWKKPHTVIDMQVSTDGPYITTTDGWTVRFWDAASFNAIKEVGLSLSVECASLLERRTSMWWVARMRAFFCACINLCNMGWYSARIPQKYAANCVAECDQ